MNSINDVEFLRAYLIGASMITDSKMKEVFKNLLKSMSVDEIRVEILDSEALRKCECTEHYLQMLDDVNN